MASKLRTASWVLLALMGAVILLISCASAYLAYSGDYPIGGVPVAQVAAGREGVLTALRGIRGTSAAYAAGFAVLYLAKPGAGGPSSRPRSRLRSSGSPASPCWGSPWGRGVRVPRSRRPR